MDKCEVHSVGLRLGDQGANPQSAMNSLTGFGQSLPVSLTTSEDKKGGKITATL